jgi:hypothetical protein
MLDMVMASRRLDRNPPVEPARPGDIQLAEPTAVTRTLTGKDELLTIGSMLLLTMLVIGAALTQALARPRPVPLVARTRDHRR